MAFLRIDMAIYSIMKTEKKHVYQQVKTLEQHMREDADSVVRSESKLVHLEQPLIPLPLPAASQAARDAYDAKLCLTFKMRWHDLCLVVSKLELFETIKAFHTCKQEDGKSVSPYLLKMKGYLDTFECLGYPMPKELGVSLILNSLNKDYDEFVQNYNMHNMGKKIVELHTMLNLHKKGIPKKAETPTVLTIRDGMIQKNKKKPQGRRVRTKERISLFMLSSPRSYHRLREIIWQRTQSATTAVKLKSVIQLKVLRRRMKRNKEHKPTSLPLHHMNRALNWRISEKLYHYDLPPLQRPINRTQQD
ncbi:hypothetical protein Tco_0217759 [Tanacetum coccineum]